MKEAMDYKDDHELAAHRRKRFFRSLVDNMNQSYQDWSHFRNSSTSILKEFQGHLMSSRSAPKKVMINKLQQMTGVMLRLLISETPQVLVRTDYDDLESYAYTFEHEVNKHLREVNLEDALRDAVFRAMYSLGVVKTGLAPKDGKFQGANYEPFSACLDIDNLVADTRARRWSEVNYIGDRFFMHEDEIRKEFGSKAVEYCFVNSSHESRMQPPPRTTDFEDNPSNRLYRERLIWNIWLRRENKIVTLPDQASTPLEVVPYHGPCDGTGPYDILQFMPSGELLPIPPLHAFYERHLMINALQRKFARQCDRCKTFIPFKDPKDAKIVNDTNDGEAVGGLSFSDELKELTLGNPNPSLANAVIAESDRFDMDAGGLQLLQGSAPASETVGQDALLRETQNVHVDAMRKYILRFAKAIIYKHNWYLWTNPIRNNRIVKVHGITGIRVPVEVTPEEREGDFLQYNFDISVYSMKEETPTEKFAKLMNFIERFMFPTMEIAMQNGIVPNILEITKELARLQQLPYEKLYHMMDTRQFQEMMVQKNSTQTSAPPRLPAQTKRTYERVSRPGSTQRSQNAAMYSANAQLQKQNQQSQQNVLPV